MSLLISIVLSILLIAGCAEVKRPPGGPEDRSAPRLLGSQPEQGATEVPLTDRITLHFSERVKPPIGKEAVFISPRQTNPPKLKWKSDRLIIELADSLQPDQTYHIALSANLSDMRGNKIDTAATLAFSTGLTIDSGSVSGHVMYGGKPHGGDLVTLYRIDRISDTTTWDSLYPDYIVQSAASGFYSLQYLSEQAYRLIAFTDRNNDGRFNPSREPYGLPDRPITIGGDLPLDQVDLMLDSRDTGSVEILAAGWQLDNLLRTRFTGPISPEFLGHNPSSAVLTSLQDSTIQIPAIALRESEDHNTGSLNLYFGEVAGGMYELSLTISPDSLPLMWDSLVIDSLPDKARPSVISFHPDDIQHRVSGLNMEILFSEPLAIGKISSETFVLTLGDSTRVPLISEWTNPFRLKLTPEEWQGGEKYTLTIADFELFDLSDNRLGDSISDYKFSTIDQERIGSVSGKIATMLPGLDSAEFYLTLSDVAGKQKFEKSITAKSFFFEVPAGKYFLSGYADLNSDGKRNSGQLTPWTEAESSAKFADTIVVRSRFETTGILLQFR